MPLPQPPLGRPVLRTRGPSAGIRCLTGTPPRSTRNGRPSFAVASSPTELPAPLPLLKAPSDLMAVWLALPHPHPRLQPRLPIALQPRAVPSRPTAASLLPPPAASAAGRSRCLQHRATTPQVADHCRQQRASTKDRFPRQRATEVQPRPTRTHTEVSGARPRNRSTTPRLRFIWAA